MDDAVWNKLEAFAREQLGRPLLGGRLKLAPDSRLEEDLRLTGLDAVEFIDKWAEEFNIEAPQGFPYDRYFGPESLDVIRSILGIFSKRFRDPELVPLTLGMLAEAMRLGRWNTEEIEATTVRHLPSP
jgi:acyl carrier protein